MCFLGANSFAWRVGRQVHANVTVLAVECHRLGIFYTWILARANLSRKDFVISIPNYQPFPSADENVGFFFSMKKSLCQTFNNKVPKFNHQLRSKRHDVR